MPLKPDAVPTRAPLTPSAERKLLAQLASIWKAKDAADLRARHETGAALNRHLGPPTERLAHGRRVLKKAAARLRTSESELSRARWLAHLFRSLKDLRKQHPAMTSWTDFKAKLPALKPTSGGSGGRRRRAGRPVQAPLKGLRASLSALTKRLRQAKTPAALSEKAAFLRTVRGFAQAIRTRLQIRLTITDDAAKSSHRLGA